MSDPNANVPLPGSIPPAPDSPRKSRKPLFITLAIVIAVVLAILLYLFQPWALFTGKEVNEDLPSSASSSASGTASPSTGATVNPPAVANVTLASGPFQSFGYDTTGKASLIRLPDGSTVVRLTDFKTPNGPDLKVWLSVNPAAKAEGVRDAEYVNLGDLKGNSGNQNYQVPASATGQVWGSVVIWCDRFSVPFGAASLSPAAPSPREESGV